MEAFFNCKLPNANWLSCDCLIRINAGRLPLYKMTYFKGVIKKFDGVREVDCVNGKTFYIDARVCKGKILMPNEN